MKEFMVIIEVDEGCEIDRIVIADSEQDAIVKTARNLKWIVSKNQNVFSISVCH